MAAQVDAHLVCRYNSQGSRPPQEVTHQITSMTGARVVEYIKVHREMGKGFWGFAHSMLLSLVGLVIKFPSR